MASDLIDVGTLPNDGTGTPLRLALQRANANFQAHDAQLTALFGSVPVSWAINGAGHLILTLADTSTVDTGYVIGPPGSPGTVLRSGSGAPANTLGINGDYYLNTNPTTGTGDLYQRSAGVYAVVGNLRGPTGATGPQPWQTPPVPWAASTAYTATAPASTVTYQGSSYVCSTSHTSTSTFDATKFSVLAAKGDPGAGSGNVSGPATATNNDIVLFNADGSIKDSGKTLADLGNVKGPTTSTNGALVVFDGTAGAIKDSGTKIGTAANNALQLDGNGLLPSGNFPAPTTTAFGGVKAKAAATNQFLTAIGADGIPVAARPTAADVSGLGTAATKDVGTAAGNVVQLDTTSGYLPAVDGRNLTNLPAGPTTAGAVGTYAFASSPNQTVSFGSSYAGSSLFPSTAENYGNSSSRLTGTWRCMGSSGSTSGGVTLFLRIA